tara:strand:+ start:192 stop:2780 length:2589 start_codon:yes stop_codon:yes gene_type:complete
MAKFNDKISTRLNSQLPEFVVEQHPKFAEFLKVYYQLLESAEIQVTSIESTDGLLLETETGQENNLLLNATHIGTARTQINAGDKILNEESVFGKFENGEVVKGQTSGATATVIVEDLTNKRLFITAQNKFKLNEIIIGQTSGAEGTLNKYSPNPVQNIQDLTEFRDPDNTISDFLTTFRDEFLATLPETLASDVDKRKLIKNVRTLYRLKGTQQGHQLFFRLLFNEGSETLYPREQLLRVSDGKYDTEKVLRVTNATDDTGKLISRTITGQTSKATAIVENVIKFQIGSVDVSQMVVNKDTINGTFAIGETIQGTESDTSSYYIKATVSGLISEKNISNDGSLYTLQDPISVTGGGKSAVFTIDAIGDGSVDEIIMDNAGTDYEVGDELSFTNANTNGSGASGFVSVVNGGLTGETGTSAEHIVLEDYTQNGDNYSGDKIMQESGTGTGEITDIFISNQGSGYKFLPSVSVTSSTGSNANIKAYGTDIGRLIGVKTSELGIDYQNAPSPELNFISNLIITNAGGTFTPGNSITSSGGTSGEIISYSSDTGLCKVKTTSGDFAVGETISGGGTGTIAKIDRATTSLSVASSVDTDGQFINEDGHLSENTMKIQDSKYYQDFSYVLKVSRSINEWRDSFKKTMHTAGFYFTGQVSFQNRLNMRIKSPVEGQVSGIAGTPILSLFNTLFCSLFGRRLGTTSDGTSLRANSNHGVKVDLDTATVEHFDGNTRDLTIRNPSPDFDYTSRVRRMIEAANGNHFVKRGFAYAGPRYNTINRFHNTLFGTNNPGSGIKFKQLEELELTGTDSGLNGQKGIFLASSNPEYSRYFRTRFAIPTAWAFDSDTFDNTVQNFSKTSITWDDTTP